MRGTPLSIKCPTGCGRSVRSGELLCKTCWFKVPKELRDNVWRAWRKYQNDQGLLSQLREAQEAAIASIV